MQKTNFGLEPLVYDGASADNSAKIIRESEEKDPRLIKPFAKVVKSARGE